MNYWGMPGIPLEAGKGLTVLDHHIIQVVCDHYKVTRKELESRTRERSIAYPRQIAYYLLSTMGRTGLKVLGETFCRDHSTVIHARDKVKTEMQVTPRIKEDIFLLKEKVHTALLKK